MFVIRHIEEGWGLTAEQAEVTVLAVEDWWWW